MFSVFEKMNEEKAAKIAEAIIDSAKEVEVVNFDYFGRKHLGACRTEMLRKDSTWTYIERIDEIDNPWETNSYHGVANLGKMKDYLTSCILSASGPLSIAIKVDGKPYHHRRWLKKIK